jgi:hypothetical protein
MLVSVTLRNGWSGKFYIVFILRPPPPYKVCLVALNLSEGRMQEQLVLGVVPALSSFSAPS